MEIMCLFSFVILFFVFGILRLLFHEKHPEALSAPQTESAQFEHLRKLEDIRRLDPVAFERFVKSLFERMGYTVDTTPTSGDHGVDLVLRKSGELAIAQCKRYAGSVGQPVLRDLYGAMFDRRARRAYLVTTGTFTASAEAWSAGKALVLVDGAGLVDWINNLPSKK